MVGNLEVAEIVAVVFFCFVCFGFLVVGVEGWSGGVEWRGGCSSVDARYADADAARSLAGMLLVVGEGVLGLWCVDGEMEWDGRGTLRYWTGCRALVFAGRRVVCGDAFAAGLEN